MHIINVGKGVGADEDEPIQMWLEKIFFRAATLKRKIMDTFYIYLIKNINPSTRMPNLFQFPILNEHGGQYANTNHISILIDIY